MDVDIDIVNTFNPSKAFGWTKASMVKNGKLGPHPCGVYPQPVPVDHLTKLCAIPYEEAEQVGFMKIDFLHLNVYSHFKSRQEIEELLCLEPDWSILLDPEHQPKLFQLANHSSVLDAIKPKSIVQLADVLALIRPGKKKLLTLYQAHPISTRTLLYAKDENGYTFKKAHSIAYAHVIVLQLFLIQAGVL
jgi:DNA polymerase III alpha subunit